MDAMYPRKIKCLVVPVLLLLCYCPAWAVEQVEVRPQVGHLQPVWSVAFAADGSQAVSTGYDDSLILWDIKSGRELHKLNKITSPAVLLGDGQSVLTTLRSGGNPLKVVDVRTGEVVRTFGGHDDPIDGIVLSKDGKLAVTFTVYGLIKMWDPATGREVRQFPRSSITSLHRDDMRLYAVALSPDQKYLLLAGVFYDGDLLLLDIGSGRIVRTYRGHGDRQKKQRDPAVFCAAFTPDGQRLVTGGADHTVRVWDVATGKQIHLLEGHRERVSALALSPDGKYCLSGSEDKTAILWDLESGGKVRTFRGHKNYINAVVFSPDGRQILTGAGDKLVKLWDLASGNEIRTFSGTNAAVRCVALSTDRKRMLTGGADGTVRLWDLRSGVLVRSYPTKEERGVEAVAFAPDGRTFLTGTLFTARLWDVNSGKVIRTFATKEKGCAAFSVSFAPDGRLVMLAGPVIRVLDTSTGKEVQRIVPMRRQGDEGISVDPFFAPDGRRIVYADHYDLTVRFWDIEQQREIAVIREHDSGQFPVALSPDGRLLAAVGRFNEGWQEPGPAQWQIGLWDSATQKLVRVLPSRTPVMKMAFTPDSRTLVTMGNDLTAWDTATGAERYRIDSASGEDDHLLLLNNGEAAITTGLRSLTKYWDLRQGRQVAQFLAVGEREWMVMTPDGYYNASSAGHDRISVHLGRRMFAVDQFYDVFYRPDVVKLRLSGEDTAGLTGLTMNDALAAPPPRIRFTRHPGTTYFESAAEICYEIESAGGGIGEYRLFHNGKLLQSDGIYREMPAAREQRTLADATSAALRESLRGITITGERDRLNPRSAPRKTDRIEGCRTIVPVAGENEISITAFNRENTVQSRLHSISFQTTRSFHRPHLYIMAIGIDEYRDRTINLKFAKKDAEGFARLLAERSRRQFSRDHIHVDVIANAQASKKGILQRIDELSRAIKPGDTFILFIASHGLLLENQYYLVTHDYQGTIDAESLISTNKLLDISKQVRSLQQLFIIDSCHAGGVDAFLSGLYDARMAVLAKNMGLQVFASAKSYQGALEGYEGHGLFTYGLLKGLDHPAEADANGDAQISMSELGQYARQVVETVSGKIGHEQTPSILSFGRDAILFSR